MSARRFAVIVRREHHPPRRTLFDDFDSAKAAQLKIAHRLGTRGEPANVELIEIQVTKR
jgi:hypothetical protein